MDALFVEEVFRVPPPLGAGHSMMYRPGPRVFAQSEQYELHRPQVEQLTGRDCLKLQFRLAGHAAYRFDRRRELVLAPYEAAIVLDGSDVEKTCRVQAGTTSTITLGCDVEFLSACIDGVARELPRQVRRYLTTGQIDFYSASLPMTPEMMLAARALLTSSHPSTLRRAYFEARIVELVCDFLQSLQGGAPGAGVSRIERRSAAQLESVRERLHAEFDRPLTVPELAHAAGTNESKLTRLFRARYGMPVHDYLRTLRLNKARELLTAGEHSIGDIAARVGYEHAANFATAFKRHFGISPRQARRRGGDSGADAPAD
jgi:AraC-like DNA-binding protein